jgi:hypothetical protein
MAPRASVVAVLAGAAVLAGCGGGGGASGSTYRTALARIAEQQSRAEGAIERAVPKARSVKQITAALTTFAAAEHLLSTQVSDLKPPKNAVQANDELAVGLQSTSRSAQTAAAKIGTFKTPGQAAAYLQSHQGNRQGAQKLDDALAKLKKLGYTKGS